MEREADTSLVRRFNLQADLTEVYIVGEYGNIVKAQALTFGRKIKIVYTNEIEGTISIGDISRPTFKTYDGALRFSEMGSFSRSLSISNNGSFYFDE